MDFAPTPSQQELYDAVLDFAREQLADDVGRRDRVGEFWREGWGRCAAFGLHGLPVPRAYGGQEAGLLDTILAMEALGYGCRDNGLVFSLNAQLWSCTMPILRYGSEEQKRRYLPRLISGEWIGVHAITEPEGGSDAFAGLARARPADGGFVLDGRKTFITNGPVADLLVVFARLGEDGRDRGITAFVVEKGDPGLVQGAPFEKMGLRTSPLGEVVLDGCRIPADRRLGAAGGGQAVFQSSMEWERSCIFASHLGQMQRQLDETIRYARERRQFGRPIAKYAPVADRLVDAKVQIEAGRWLLYRVGWLKDQGRSCVLEAAMAKLFVSEAHVQIARDAIQIHGGYGYMVESGVEREMRDALGGTIYSGTSEMQRKIIAGLLGL